MYTRKEYTKDFFFDFKFSFKILQKWSSFTIEKRFLLKSTLTDGLKLYNFINSNWGLYFIVELFCWKQQFPCILCHINNVAIWFLNTVLIHPSLRWRYLFPLFWLTAAIDSTIEFLHFILAIKNKHS